MVQFYQKTRSNKILLSRYFGIIAGYNLLYKEFLLSAQIVCIATEMDKIILFDVKKAPKACLLTATFSGFLGWAWLNIFPFSLL
jgi:hypothetical protein